MNNEVKKKIEKLRNVLLDKKEKPNQIIEQLNELNNQISNLAQLISRQTSIRVENLDEIKFPSSFSIENLKENPTSLSINNFPSVQKVEMDKPDWYKEPPKIEIPEKIKIDWENQPKQKNEQPSWIEDLFKKFFDVLTKVLSKLWSKGIEVSLKEGERLKPQLVIQVDPETGKPMGKPTIIVQGGGGNITSGGYIKDKSGALINPATEDGNLAKLIGLEIAAHDYIFLGYTGNNLTSVIYKKCGAGGTTVATLTLGYDASDNLTSITKT